MKKNIEYRQPEYTDIPALSALFTHILTSSFSEYPSAAYAGYQKAWNPEILEKRIAAHNDLLLIATVDNIPIGLVSGPTPEAGVGTVIWLLVDEQARGLKIGSTLFQLACQHFRNLSCHKLKLNASNQGAREFYLKLGMREEGFHAKHWWKADFWSFGMDL